ncbi:MULTISPECIES: hypothetical protein [unclassified Streptomyces]|nr:MULTISPECIES: hypothetical protein [unclassified Streptomyces]
MTHRILARGHSYGGDPLPGWVLLTIIVVFAAYLGYRYWQGK